MRGYETRLRKKQKRSSQLERKSSGEDIAWVDLPEEVDGLVAAGKYREALSMLQALDVSILLKRAACAEGLNVPIASTASSIVASTIASMTCCICLGTMSDPTSLSCLLWPQCVPGVLEGEFQKRWECLSHMSQSCFCSGAGWLDGEHHLATGTACSHTPPTP